VVVSLLLHRQQFAQNKVFFSFLETFWMHSAREVLHCLSISKGGLFEVTGCCCHLGVVAVLARFFWGKNKATLGVKKLQRLPSSGEDETG